jgi:L-aminopeptidase/D-esterase-like protein
MTQCRNLISDVPGLRVGNAHDADLCSGVTSVIFDRPLITAMDVRGGGPGTRESDAVGLAGSLEEAHGLVLSGGSAFGLSAATGVQSWLAERGIGFDIGGVRVPIVPQAVLFDLLNGGNKNWGASPPYEGLARLACDQAGIDFALGSAGAGFGATTVALRGGLGSASATLANGLVVGALVAVNAVGSATIGDTRHFWAAPFESDNEFGGHGLPSPMSDGGLDVRLKGGPGEATTIAIVATNAALTKRQAFRLAVMAQTGLARAIYPVHTPLDGDVVFAAVTGQVMLADPIVSLTQLGSAAANVLARAVARGVYEAAAVPPNWRGPPAWRTRFGHLADR